MGFYPGKTVGAVTVLVGDGDVIMSGGGDDRMAVIHFSPGGKAAGVRRGKDVPEPTGPPVVTIGFAELSLLEEFVKGVQTILDAAIERAANKSGGIVAK